MVNGKDRKCGTTDGEWQNSKRGRNGKNQGWLYLDLNIYFHVLVLGV